MKKALLPFILIFVLISALASCTFSRSKQIETNTETNSTSEIEYPIFDVWVYRYNVQTESYDFSPCGYVDEYTSIVNNKKDNVVKTISGTYMYLGTIKGYQNDDKTIEVYQVKLPELSPNFALTNDSVKLDYSGNSKMIEVVGWIYLNGTEIIAVSPLYSE